MTRAELNMATNERRQKVLDAAHERWQRNHDSFVMRNPNAVSPTERGEVFRRVERRGLEAHEMQMLKERQKGDLAIAREKRFGMENQGAEAARISSAAEKEWRKDAAEKGVTEAEKEWAARKEIGQLESDARKYEAEKRLEGVNATNATQERIESEKARLSALEAEKQREHEFAIQAGKNFTSERVANIRGSASVEAAKSRVETARIAGRNKIVDRINAGGIVDGMMKSRWDRMTVEEQQAWLDEHTH